MNTAQTIYVIDPGRVGLLGHQYALNRMIGEHARNAGYDLQYLVDQGSGEDLVAALNARPVLDFNIYATPPATLAAARDMIAQGNLSAAKNLAQALAAAQNGDVIVFHTISYLGLVGAANWAKTHAPKGLKIRILLRFPAGYSPNFQDIPPDVVLELEREFADGLKAWAHLDQDVSFFGDSYEILNYLKSLMSWDVPLLPTSIAFNHCTPVPPREPDQPPVFLLAGNGRKEKGIVILAEAIDRFLKEGGRGRFVIQSVINPEIAKLFDPFGQSVEIPNRHMEGADYFAFLSTADAVLVAYDPIKYANRTSHVLIEGLGAGRPVITTGGTWMQEEADRISPGSALYMASYSSTALFECLMRFCRERHVLSQSAWTQAPHVRDVHGETRFLSTFLGF